MSNMRSGTAGRRARRRFTSEFKTGAVRVVLDEGKTIGAVARELDLTPLALAYWVSRAQADRTKGRTGLTSEERAELARLRKGNRELRMERNTLSRRRISTLLGSTSQSCSITRARKASGTNSAMAREVPE